ncbi:TIGR00730 family Rossman fold protein [Microbulbifer halophilus]|uniref:Cytokinin riboside 5'-monophosphate phosphoribohydrolase n=1 Tax=Microbulbifer halophilus TaxID=453963 RepID=A0ABW5EDW1_9GAMM|nr:TIGR00730 family Rossman fold protein [Microbulbifer halophilus]MCW8127877.1 TIGR00730 family Rossman fold protein [Microbulbifer halophilus]
MKNICVYCGSNPGRRPEYRQAAEALAAELLARDIGLVYGGASIGVMGAVADAVLAGGGRVTGVIPEALAVREVPHPDLTEMHVVGSMHERKAMMESLSDGFIALPGGLGTLEELFEILTWAQLGFHCKPCGLLNVSSYFQHLASFLDHCVAEQLLRPQYRNMLLEADRPAELLALMDEYQPPVMDHRLSRDDL